MSGVFGGVAAPPVAPVVGIEPRSAIQEFTQSGPTGLIAPPTWATHVELTGDGAGGGSGGGAKGVPGSTIFGGNSGTSGNRSIQKYSLKDLATALGLTVAQLRFESNIPVGGLAGPAIATNNTSGNTGTSGGTLIVKARNELNSASATILLAAGGEKGAGGKASATPASSAVPAPGMYLGTAGAQGQSVSGSNSSSSNLTASAGGGGAGQNGPLKASLGGISGAAAFANYGYLAGGAPAGTDAPNPIIPGIPGVGGGGGNALADGTGTRGGHGKRGGGGGGGPGTANGTPAVTGGDGGGGYLMLRWTNY